jgi:hypothetical protein
MHKSYLVLAAALLLGLPTVASAGGLTEGAELEHARANARAGGPVSERDQELLERYGCLSGTRSPACGNYYVPRRYYRARRHRH